MARSVSSWVAFKTRHILSNWSLMTVWLLLHLQAESISALLFVEMLLLFSLCGGGIEPRACCVLGRCFTMELCLVPSASRFMITKVEFVMEYVYQFLILWRQMDLSYSGCSPVWQLWVQTLVCPSFLMGSLGSECHASTGWMKYPTDLGWMSLWARVL